MERRSNGLFVGNVYVGSVDRVGRRPRSLRLTDAAAAAIGRGLAEERSIIFDGTIRTFVARYDEAMRLRACGMCGDFFIGHHAARLCSDECLARSRKARRDARRPARKPSKGDQRRVALAEVICRECGMTIQAKRLTARFCSERCRQRHHRRGGDAVDVDRSR